MSLRKRNLIPDLEKCVSSELACALNRAKLSDRNASYVWDSTEISIGIDHQ